MLFNFIIKNNLRRVICLVHSSSTLISYVNNKLVEKVWKYNFLIQSTEKTVSGKNKISYFILFSSTYLKAYGISNLELEFFK